MANLIKISNNKISDFEVKTVNARELHNFLEVKSRFNDWINNRIRDFGFVENQDFVTVTKNLVSGGIQKEIYLSIDMAKELSMVERNEKGKQARQYFIEMEKVAKSTINYGRIHREISHIPIMTIVFLYESYRS